MFSGLIQTTGTIAACQGTRLRVDFAPGRLRVGGSVAVNGVCLTIVAKRKAKKATRVDFDLSPETLARTTLGRLGPGARVNIEPALRMGDVLGGHIVQGHVDGVGQVDEVVPERSGCTIWWRPPSKFERYLVEKGSVAIDGVSLTVASLSGARFSTALIPYTLVHTNLGALKKGDRVNLEADVMAKYVQKYVRR